MRRDAQRVILSNLEINMPGFAALRLRILVPSHGQPIGMIIEYVFSTAMLESEISEPSDVQKRVGPWE